MQDYELDHNEMLRRMLAAVGCAPGYRVAWGDGCETFFVYPAAHQTEFAVTLELLERVAAGEAGAMQELRGKVTRACQEAAPRSTGRRDKGRLR